jgi:hypothetical protein
LNNHSICFQNRSLKDERFFLPKKKAKYELVNAANFGKSRESSSESGKPIAFTCPIPPLQRQHLLMKLNSLLFSALLLTATSANAELLTDVSIHSSTTVGLNEEMAPDKAINGFGLDGDAPALTGSHRQGHDTNWWTGWDGGITEWQLTVDLEDNYELDLIHVWNYREGCCTGRGLSSVEIYVSPDENEDNLVKLVTDGSGLHDNESGGFLFPQAPTDAEYFGFDLDMSGVTNSDLLGNVRLFRIDGGAINHGGGDWGGLAEIQFSGLPPSGGAAFAITNLEQIEGGNSLTWNSRAGASYSLEYSLDLEEWIEITDDVPADSKTTVYEHYFSPDFEELVDETKLFYRVVKNE